MMADITNVYIPLCGNQACEIKLKKIASLVTKCRTDHKPTGKYSEWFQGYFEDNHVTVIHFCPVLWRKIKVFEDQLKKSAGQIILLNLDVEEFAPRYQNDDMDSVTIFFNDIGSEQWVSTEDELQDFVQMVKQHVQDFVRENGENTGLQLQEDENFPQSDPSSEASSHRPTGNFNPSPGATKSESNLYDEPTGPLQPQPDLKLKKYPNIFGQTDHQKVFISRSYLLGYCPSVSNIYSPGKSSSVSCSIIEHNKNLNPDQVLCNNSYILHKILPNIYTNKDIVALASVCKCTYPDLQKRALILLELCLWEDDVVDPRTYVTNLFKTEEMLNDVLEALTKKYEQNMDKVSLGLLDRASNVYLIILSAIVMSDETDACSKHLNTIRFRRQSSSSVHQEAKKFLDKCDAFIKESNDSLMVATKVRSKIKKLTEEEIALSHSLLKKLPSKSCIPQVVFIFEMLKKVFKSDPVENAPILKFLCTYILMQKRPSQYLTWKAQWKSVCTVMVLRAFTLFLKYHSLNKAHMEFKKPHKAILKGLADCFQPSMHLFTGEVMRLLQSLSFHPNNVIRSEVIRTLSKRKQNKSLATQYQKESVDIREEIADIMDPLLSLDNKISALEESTWQCSPAKFGCKSVLVYYHVMKKKQLFEDIKVHLENHKDSYFNEMYSLMHLQNEHIIQLFAFQRFQVPCFYIIENLPQNLQDVMQNFRKNERFICHLDLCRLLLDAVSGLQYCHDNNWIHRNLTAKSLAYCASKRVKLSSFGLCEELGPSEKVKDLDNQSTPFRWSAPESILQSVYSKLSDIWMVGVLIYEVMTHGVLPFLGISDSTLWELMKEKSAQLSKEKCFDEKMYHLMIGCSRFEPASRPFIENVKTTIETIIEEHSSNPRTVEEYPYPEIKIDRRPSTIKSRGVPSHLRSASLYCGMDYSSQISEILLRGEKLNGKYVFQEKVVHTMPPAVLSIFEWESFKQIFTQDFDLHQAQGTRQSPVQFIYSTVDRSSSLLSEIQEGRFDLQKLLEVVYEVALKLSKMADLNLVLGDLYPSAVYVDKQNHRKVYIISLAFMKKTTLTDYSTYTTKLPPIPDFMVHRAAPQVSQENDFTPMSDVYCFGSFVSEVLASLSKQRRKMSRKEIYVAHNTRALNCPDKIYQLVKLCVSQQRPSMKYIVKKLEEYYRELYHEDLAPTDSPSADDCSPQESSPYSILHEVNPSTMAGSILYEVNPSSTDSFLYEVNPSSMDSSLYELIDSSWSSGNEEDMDLTQVKTTFQDYLTYMDPAPSPIVPATTPPPLPPKKDLK